MLLRTPMVSKTFYKSFVRTHPIKQLKLRDLIEISIASNLVNLYATGNMSQVSSRVELKGSECAQPIQVFRGHSTPYMRASNAMSLNPAANCTNTPYHTFMAIPQFSFSSLTTTWLISGSLSHASKALSVLILCTDQRVMV